MANTEHYRNLRISTFGERSRGGLKDKDSFSYWHDIICDEFVRLDCEQLSTGSFEGELRGGANIADLCFSEIVSDPQHVIRSKRQIVNSTEWSGGVT